MSTPTDETPGEDTGLAEKVARYVNAGAGNPFVLDVTAEAIHLVDRHIGKADVPAPIRTRAIVETAADLFWRQQARSGLATFDGGEAGGTEVVHIGTDPLRAVRPILRPYLPGGFA